MHSFTSLSQSFSINKNDIVKFDILSAAIIEKWKKIDPAMNVFPKLHMLTHYSQLTYFFGPPVLFSTLKYERKHIDFKNWANIMGNYKNPPKSFANRDQLTLAVNHVSEKYFDINFFPATQPAFDIFSILCHSLTNSQKLLATEYPFPITPITIFQIKQRRNKFWLRPVSFRKTANGSVFACGQILEQVFDKTQDIVSKMQMKYYNPKCRHPGKLNCKCSWKYINIININHRVDFLFIYDNDFFLVKGLI